MITAGVDCGAKTPRPDMARAIHNAIADRIVSMVRRVGAEDVGSVSSHSPIPTILSGYEESL